MKPCAVGRLALRPENVRCLCTSATASRSSSAPVEREGLKKPENRGWRIPKFEQQIWAAQNLNRLNDKQLQILRESNSRDIPAPIKATSVRRPVIALIPRVFGLIWFRSVLFLF